MELLETMAKNSQQIQNLTQSFLLFRAPPTQQEHGGGGDRRKVGYGGNVQSTPITLLLLLSDGEL